MKVSGPENPSPIKASPGASTTRLQSERQRWCACGVRVLFAALCLSSMLPIAMAASFGLQAASSHDAQGRMIVPEKIMAGYCTRQVSPKYPAGPPLAKRESAAVVLRVVIQRSGTVIPVEAVSGPPRLIDEAANAARLWRFRPYLSDGEAVEVLTEIRLVFKPGYSGGVLTYPGP